MFGYVYKTYDMKRDKYYVGQKKSNVFIPTYHGSGTIIKNIAKLKRDIIEIIARRFQGI